MWQEATGVHADARVGCHVAEGRQVKGPRVSGPWYVYWGGYANGYHLSIIYSHHFHSLLPCGTMFPHGSNVQVAWRLHGRWIILRGVDRVHLSSRDQNHSTCVICTLSDRDQRAHRLMRGATRSA